MLLMIYAAVVNIRARGWQIKVLKSIMVFGCSTEITKNVNYYMFQDKVNYMPFFPFMFQDKLCTLLHKLITVSNSVIASAKQVNFCYVQL